MKTISFSRLTVFDVKWMGEVIGNLPLSRKKQHPFFQLLIVTNGPVYLQAGDTKYTLESGELLFLLPWEEHCSWKPIDEQSGFYWVQFQAYSNQKQSKGTVEVNVMENKHPSAPFAQDLRTLADNEELVDPLVLPIHFQPKYRFEFLSLFEQLLKIMEHPIGNYRFECSLLLGSMIGKIADAWLQNNDNNAEQSTSYLLYRKLVNLLDEEFTTELSAEVFEAKLHHTYEYLCQVFKKYSGTTIVTYVHDLRIQRAKHLLAEGNQHIQDIAEHIGFSDPYYFSRLFKSKEGISPLHYREKVRSKR